MDKNEALDMVRKELPDKRFNHTLGVVKTATSLAREYHVNIEKAELAAILHDLAKYWSKETMTPLILESNISNDLLKYHISLWHSHVGAAYLQKNGLKDEAVLDAIRFHTTGRANMTKLEKIVFLADYIEPGRQFPGIDDVRKLARSNLDHAVLKSLVNTILFLIKRKQQIHPDTIEAYNELVLSREA